MIRKFGVFILCTLLDFATGTAYIYNVYNVEIAARQIFWHQFDTKHVDKGGNFQGKTEKIVLINQYKIIPYVSIKTLKSKKISHKPSIHTGLYDVL